VLRDLHPEEPPQQLPEVLQCDAAVAQMWHLGMFWLAKKPEFTGENADFTSKNGDFTSKNGDFTSENGDFTSKTGGSRSKHGDLTSRKVISPAKVMLQAAKK